MSPTSPILPDGEEAVISIRGLRNAFGEQVIHEDLDFDVRRGEIIGVVGGSGTGKSVLMRSIIGLQSPDSGTVQVLGEDMLGRDEDEAKNIRRRWGVLFQAGALFSTLTVAENVEVEVVVDDLLAFVAERVAQAANADDGLFAVGQRR